jgi:hypothetical protein
MADLPKDPEALGIAVDLLDRTGRAMMTRDFDRFAGCYNLPHRISNFDEEYLITDPAALHRGFDKVSDELAMLGVTDLVRDCIAAERIDTDTVHFAHVSHLMAGARRVKPPYPCFSVVRWIAGRWLLVATDYAIEAESGQARAMKLAASTEVARFTRLTDADAGAGAGRIPPEGVR